MGGCCKGQEYNSDDAPDSKKQTLKILFLGSGGCGKSTLFKQLKKLYGEGITGKDKRDAVHGIATFVVETMQTLLEEYRSNNEEFKDDDVAKAAKQIESISLVTSASFRLNEKVSKNIKLLWNQPEIKAIFDETAKMHLNGPCAYFFDAMDRISDPNFQPTDKDILLQRRPTTGLIEQHIAKTDFEDVRFLMIDVGGQRNERKKWIHQFENVAAIVYVISLSAYDEPLYEDTTINSLKDSIELFQETINSDSHWFKQSSLFLIFNKKDLFEQKIINKSLKECFDDDSYDEKQYFHDLEDPQKQLRNIEFIKQQFIKQIKDESKPVITFETCAYEEDQVTNVFTTILKNIVDKSKIVPT